MLSEVNVIFICENIIFEIETFLQDAFRLNPINIYKNILPCIIVLFSRRGPLIFLCILVVLFDNYLLLKCYAILQDLYKNRILAVWRSSTDKPLDGATSITRRSTILFFRINCEILFVVRLIKIWRAQFVAKF